MRAPLAVLLATLTSSLYALSTSLQALEARQEPDERALRATLLASLVRRRVWLVGAAAGVAAWALQALALSLASVALVQPALGLGLVVLLVLGARVLHEHVGVREITGAVAIAGAVAALGWAAPHETGAFTHRGSWAIGAALVLVAGAPYALRAAGRVGGLETSICAGLGWAWVGLGTALFDDALASRRFVAVVGWALAVALASWSTLLSEMTALQSWPATRSVPIAFGLEMVAPAAVAPLVSRGDPRNTALFAGALVVAAAGAALLGSSRAVARQLTAP